MTRSPASHDVTFEVTMLWPGAFLVVASTGEVIGIFNGYETVMQACEKYRASRTLH
jgi:hypothetical protein